MQKEITSKQLASVGLFSALVFLATFVLKIPTPALGYVHIGDGFVLLAGFLLGPVYGALAAGIGSALSDLLGGYAVFVPGSFIIKFLTAFVASRIYRSLLHVSEHKSTGSHEASLRSRSLLLLPSGIAGELVMTAGYFLYNIGILFLAGSSSNAPAGLSAAAAASLAEVPFNLVQGFLGICISMGLYPLIAKGMARVRYSIR